MNASHSGGDLNNRHGKKTGTPQKKTSTVHDFQRVPHPPIDLVPRKRLSGVEELCMHQLYLTDVDYRTSPSYHVQIYKHVPPYIVMNMA